MFPAVVVLDHFLTEHRLANPGSKLARLHRRCPCGRARTGLGGSNGEAGELDDSFIGSSHRGPLPAPSAAPGFTTGDSGDSSTGGLAVEDDFKSAAADLRPVERFFATIWAPLVSKSAAVFAGAFFLVTALVGIVYTVHLQKATTQVQIWPDGYMAVMYDAAEAEGWPEIFTTTFGCEPECEDVLFVFGCEATDNGRKFHAEWPKGEEHMIFDRGSLVFDDAFSLETEAAQLWLLNFTANARKLPMFALRAEDNAVVLPDPQHPVLPPLVMEAAMSPGPIWEVDSAYLFPSYQNCYGTCIDPQKAVKLGGGCELGPGFAACFDAYVASAAAGYTPTDGQKAIASAAGLDLPEHIKGIDVPTLAYDSKGLRSIGVALHSTLDGREQGRWDYQTRSASWGLLEKFVEAQTLGVAFSYCEPTNLDIHEMWTCNGNEGDGYVENADGCAKAGNSLGQCKWVTLPGIGAAPAGLRTGWFHAPWFITTDLQETMVTAVRTAHTATLEMFVCRSSFRIIPGTFLSLCSLCRRLSPAALRCC